MNWIEKLMRRWECWNSGHLDRKVERKGKMRHSCLRCGRTR